ncbi:phage antirepressor N-terminal domain-containing protein [Malikia sp.]|uniref:phage antirepressor N-terminal domain-containing protein n=1 Tax=Malikia sp. TaxID=2070706 RepID=UPI002624A673|nr:phage antirepressor N-terminal domain-containing protein [Malikia sp.]MDD2728501.1 phage antirepressor N-terminal domain-containing protein [Malikia sp.]
MSHTLVNVEFHGQSLVAVLIDGQPYVAMKPICENIGLQWNGQFERINRNPVMKEGIRVTRTPSKGGDQETVCLPLDMLNGWLFGVDVNRVREEIKPRLIQYQKECFGVLFRHFMPQPAASAPAPALARPPKLSCDDLSFTRRDAQGRRVNWSVEPRCRLWHEGLERGEAFFREVAELAAHDEHEAYNAIRFAFGDEWQLPTSGSTQWSNRGAGEEMGFAEAVARAVIDGLRARRHGVDPFNPERKTSRGRPRDKSSGPKLLPSVLTPPTQQRLLA